MGTLITTSIMIKLLLTSSLLALTAAEADPQVLSYAAPLAYGAAGVPYVGATVGAVAHAPVVKSDVITPAEVDHEVTAHTVPVAVGYHGLGPVTDRGFYGHPYACLHYAGLPIVAPAAPAAAEAVVAERKKREADPQVLLNAALPYAAPILAPVGAVAHAPVVKSVVDSPAEVSHEVTAHTVPVAVGYHGLPYWG